MCTFQRNRDRCWKKRERSLPFLSCFRSGLVHVNAGRRGAEISGDLLALKPEVIFVELGEEDDNQLHGCIPLAIQKGHIILNDWDGLDAYALDFIYNNVGMALCVSSRDLRRA